MGVPLFLFQGCALGRHSGLRGDGRLVVGINPDHAEGRASRGIPNPRSAIKFN